MLTLREELEDWYGKEEFNKLSEVEKQDLLLVNYYAGLILRSTKNKLCREKNHIPKICSDCKSI